MKSGEINSLFNNLSKVIKNPKSDLKYKNKFTLLVSVVLSAQCTDVMLITSQKIFIQNTISLSILLIWEGKKLKN